MRKKRFIILPKISIIRLIALFMSCMLTACDLIPIRLNEITATAPLNLTNYIGEIPADAQGLLDISLPACVQDLSEYQIAYVTRVIDGDSIEVIVDGEKEQVRYIGVNTPEYYSEERDAAVAATHVNRALVEGQYVLLVRDLSDRDKYERLLRYVFTTGGFVNYELVKEGAAEVKEYPPDIACHEYLLLADP
jgi:endonuclease YncB( thermonuclease family)